jgi:hypothetical protein
LVHAEDAAAADALDSPTDEEHGEVLGDGGTEKGAQRE